MKRERGVKINIPIVEATKYDSKWEAAYAGYLELRKRAGEIYEWQHKPLRLRIGKGTAFYTPDFSVINLDGEIELHEVKGYWREAAKVRIKVAADRHPYKFVVVTKGEFDGSWKEEVV